MQVIDLAIDLYGVMKKCEVTTMEGGYVENAGAVFYHLTGDEYFFHYAIRTRKLCRLSVSQLINPGSTQRLSITPLKVALGRMISDTFPASDR